MKLVLFLLTLLVVFFIFSCGGGSSSNSISNPDPVDTNSNVKFQEVLAIISDNCQNCHGSTLANNAPMSLVTHTQISLFASSISSRINKSANDSQLMPPSGPKLSAEDIATIDTWIIEGKLNN
jgi:uncharacterized membrane protein